MDEIYINQNHMDMINSLLKRGITSVEKLDKALAPPKYIIIPLSIAEHPNLTANAKILYGEIDALSKPGAPCWATNEYLSKRLHIGTETVKDSLRTLHKEGLILINVEKNSYGTFRTMCPAIELREGAKPTLGEGTHSTPPEGIKSPPLKRTRNKRTILPSIADSREPQVESAFSGEPVTDKQQLTPLQKVVKGYKSIKGFDMEDKDWDKRNFARAARPAKALLEAFGNDWEAVVDYMDEFKKEYDKKHLDFTIETMLRKYDDWRLAHVNRR